MTTFGLSHYVTSPDRVNAPYLDSHLSKRHNLTWFADLASKPNLEALQSTLRKAHPSLKERRDSSMVSAKEKRARLKELLAKIQAGNFGLFAAQNHTTSYRFVGSERELDSVLVNIAFQLPVERNHARQLIVEMHTYRLENCSEG